MTAERRAFAFVVVAAIACVWLLFNTIVWFYGESPARATALLFQGTWGTAYGIGRIIAKATPLIFAGLAVFVALRAGLFNIGVEGQAAVSALAAAVVATHIPASVPGPIAIAFVIAVAIVTASLWAAIPAFLKAQWGAHEVVSTIMMNRLADIYVAWALSTQIALKGTVRTADVPKSTRLAMLDSLGLSVFHESGASVAFVVAVALCGVVAVLERRALFFLELRLLGQGRDACLAAKIPVQRREVEALVVSGALAGLVAIGTVFGYKGYFENGLGAGVGFSGIAVAILARRSAIGVIAAALLLATLEQGGLAINALVPMEVMDILRAALIIVVALASESIRKLAFRSLAAAARRVEAVP